MQIFEMAKKLAREYVKLTDKKCDVRLLTLVPKKIVAIAKIQAAQMKTQQKRLVVY